MANIHEEPAVACLGIISDDDDDDDDDDDEYDDDRYSSEHEKVMIKIFDSASA